MRLATVALVASILGCSSGSLLGQAEKKAEKKADKPAEKKIDPKLEELAKALKAKNAADRVKAAEDIAKLGPDAAPITADLCKAMLDPSPKVNQAALEALEKVNAELYKPLVVLAVDKVPTNHVKAIKTLGLMGEDAAPVAPIVATYLKKTITDQKLGTFNRREIVKECIETLGKIAPEDPINLATLIGLAGPLGSDPDMRAYALVQLGNMAEAKEEFRKKVLPTLVSGVNDGSQPIKLAAIEALAKLGPDAKSAIPTLKKCKMDSSARIREAATAALEKIEG